MLLAVREEDATVSSMWFGQTWRPTASVPVPTTVFNFFQIKHDFFSQENNILLKHELLETHEIFTATTTNF